VYTTERESELYLVVSGIFENLPGIFIFHMDYVPDTRSRIIARRAIQR
jgi:hypothetical protein